MEEVLNDCFVITGMSGRLPESDNLEEFWNNLLNGVDMVTEDDRRWPRGYCGTPLRKGTLKADLSHFDASFFGINPKNADKLDPQIRILLEVTHEAIIDAGINPSTLRGSKTGVFVGASSHEAFEACRVHPDKVSGYDITSSSGCMFANRVSYTFDFHGPSLTMDTYCSSSLMALHSALSAMKAGQCDSAIVAGINLLLNPMTSLQMLRLGTLSTDGKCKSFDASGDGYVRSEAIVAILIQKKTDAQRVYAQLVHSKANADGFKENGVSYPSGIAQQSLMEEAYKEAGLNPLEVFYVEAHGTGTKAGDPQELNAISEVFCCSKENRPSGPLLIGSVKSNVGHAEGAASLVAVIKVALCLQNRIIPANLHFKQPNAEIPALTDGRIKVVSRNFSIEEPENRSLLMSVNATGIGGSNIHCILQSCLTSKSNANELQSNFVFTPFSGRTHTGLQNSFKQIVNKSMEDLNFNKLCQNVHAIPVIGNDFRGYCLSTVAANETSAPRFEIKKCAKETRRPLWFVFSGMGTQWCGMGSEFMAFPPFRSSILKSAEIVEPYGVNLIQLLTSDDEKLLNKHMSLSFMAMGIALVDLLSSVGVKPDGVIGHSAGELLCGYSQGSLTRSECLLSFYYKDICVAECFGGGMAAVGLTWEQAHARCPLGIFPACHNAVDNVTISGPQDKLKEFVAELKSDGIFAREVSTGGVAYHSAYLKHVVPTFHSYLKSVIPISRPRLPGWLSTSVHPLEWDVNTECKHASANYIIHNFQSPVYFHEAIVQIPKGSVVLEVSSHCLFQSILKRTLGSKDCIFLKTMKKNSRDNWVEFLECLAQLYLEGFNLNFYALDYSKPAFPVMLLPGTFGLGSLIYWDHSQTFQLPHCLPDLNLGEEIEILLSSEEYSFLSGHCIDGRVLFPATGYLVLAWKRLATGLGKTMEQLPVEFKNVRFERAAILSIEHSTKLKVQMMEESGDFEITEGESLLAKGNVKVFEDDYPSDNILNPKVIQEKCQPSPLQLSTSDVYKELRLRGYQYDGIFKGIHSMHIEGENGFVSWKGNWIAFLDTLIQFPIVSTTNRGMFIPTRVERVKINPQHTLNSLVSNSKNSNFNGNGNLLVTKFLFYETDRHCIEVNINSNGFKDGDEELVNVKYCPNTKQINTQGVQIQNIKMTLVPRTFQDDENKPILEEYRFIPYFDNEDDNFLVKDSALKTCIDIFLENLDTDISQLSIAEILQENGQSLKNEVIGFINQQPSKQIEDNNIWKILYGVDENTLHETGSCSSNNVSDCVSSVCKGQENTNNSSEIRDEKDKFDLLVMNYHKGNKLANGWQSLVDPGGFLLIQQETDANANTLNEMQIFGFNLVAKKSYSQLDGKMQHFILYKEVSNDSASEETSKTIVIDMDSNKDQTNFHWLSALQDVLKLEHKSNFISTENSNLNFNNKFDLSKHFEKSDTNETSKQSVGEIHLVSTSEPASGVIGLINCLRKEPGGERIRCFFNAASENNIQTEIPINLKSNKISSMVMNIYEQTHGNESMKFGSYRHLPLKFPTETSSITSKDAFVNVLIRGDLSSLKWIEQQPIKQNNLRQNECICDVFYAPLNFRDVMLASGKLSADALPGDLALQECILGLEFAGIVNEGKFKGHKVMGAVKAKGMSTFVIADTHFMWKCPQKWTLEQASTIPIAYATAYYALIVRGRLEHGESLLIHLGSGGVGQAAIRIALSLDCKVFTSVGSKEKKLVLQSLFPQLTDDRIVNSRDVKFEEEILKATKGKGLDLVLNSLAEEKLEASLRCVAEGGRFLEIGKFDLSNNSSLGMSFFLQNCTFHGILLDALFETNEKAKREKVRVVNLVEQGIKNGVVQPLKVTLFQPNQLEDAFRFMASGKHTGKVVLQIRQENALNSSLQTQTSLDSFIVPIQRVYFDSNKCYIIIGGLGGFGLELANWFVSRGVRKLVLVSRSGVTTGYQRICLRRWQHVNCNVKVYKGDLAIKEDAEKFLKDYLWLGPIGGIFNLAMVLKDGFFEQQTEDSFNSVCRPKVDVTHNLDVLTRSSPYLESLDFFVVFSSISCGRGNAGQSSYGYANSAAERICEQRRKSGLPALAIQWGAINDVGFVHDEMINKNSGRSLREDFTVAGTIPQKINSCLKVLDKLLANQKKICPVVSSYVLPQMNKAGDKRENNSDALESLDAEGNEVSALIAKVAKILGVKTNELTASKKERTLVEFGLDSMMTVEIKQTLKRMTKTNLSEQQIRKLTWETIDALNK